MAKAMEWKNILQPWNHKFQRGIYCTKKNLEFKLLSPEICDPQGRYIILNIEIMGSPFTLINYYAPNNLIS